MNEEEREVVKKFERLYLKDFNNEKITNEDRLSYIEYVLMTNLIEKLQKENEKLEEINNELEAEKNEAIRRYNFETIPIQKIKDKIEKEIKYHEKNILDIENITMLKSKTAKEEVEIEFNKYAIVVLNKILQELIEESEEK